MMNRAIANLGTAALVAGCLVFAGCSSSGEEPGPGGGTGGSNAAAYIPAGPVCAATVKNKGVCTVGVDQPCANTCGPLKAGVKNCACVAGAWSCPVCGYDPAKDYSCYQPGAALAACPPSAANPDPSGMNLPQSGDACSIPVCQPCGSGTSPAYRDSSGIGKVGYCVCSSAVDGVYSCASALEWAPIR